MIADRIGNCVGRDVGMAQAGKSGVAAGVTAMGVGVGWVKASKEICGEANSRE